MELNNIKMSVLMPSVIEMENIGNRTMVVTKIEETLVREVPHDKDELVTEAWIGVILTMLVVMCACSMCGFLVYSRIQVLRRRERRRQNGEQVEDEESKSYQDTLPSYTIVTGLPSYKTALEQMKKVKGDKVIKGDGKESDKNDPSQVPSVTLSVIDLFKCSKDEALSKNRIEDV